MLKRNNEYVYLNTSKYAVDDTLAIVMTCEDGSPFAVLTVNIQETLKPNHAFVDTNNMGDDIINWIEENKLGKYTGRMGFSGFCIYPEFDFNLEEIEKYTYK